MTARTATFSDPSPDDASTCGEARRERQLAMLDRLAEIGMTIVEEIGRQVMQPSGAEAPRDPSIFHNDLVLAFSRASRAVRMTIALQARLMEEPRRGDQGAGRTIEDLVALLDSEPDPEKHEQASRNEADSEAAERLVHERLERETYGDLMGRPVSEIIGHIRRDLGLEPVQSRPAPGAGEETESGAASPEEGGSPFQDDSWPEAADLPPFTPRARGDP